MYNPVNNAIQDADRLKEKDQRENNKRKRYQDRYVFDNKTKVESLAEQDRQDKMQLRKVNPQRFEFETSRGFDILGNGPIKPRANDDHETAFNKLVQRPKPVWTKVQQSELSISDYKAPSRNASTFIPKTTKNEGVILSKMRFNNRNDRIQSQTAKNSTQRSQRSEIRTGGF